jgi:hypothetical protein
VLSQPTLVSLTNELAKLKNITESYNWSKDYTTPKILKELSQLKIIGLDKKKLINLIIGVTKQATDRQTIVNEVPSFDVDDLKKLNTLHKETVNAIQLLKTNIIKFDKQAITKETVDQTFVMVQTLSDQLYNWRTIALDLYLFARLLKPYVHRAIVMCGDTHVENTTSALLMFKFQQVSLAPLIMNRFDYFSYGRSWVRLPDNVITTPLPLRNYRIVVTRMDDKNYLYIAILDKNKTDIHYISLDTKSEIPISQCQNISKLSVL